MKQALRTIADFCVRRNKDIFFENDGQIRLNGDTHTVQELAAEINKDEQRRCHEELVTWMRQELTITDGNTLDELLKASEECLAQQ